MNKYRIKRNENNTFLISGIKGGATMKSYQEMTREELLQEKAQLEANSL